MLRGRGCIFAFIGGLLCLGGTKLALAEGLQEGWADTVQFNFENDVFRADTNRDRNYTYGVDAVFASEFNTRSPLSRLHRWLHRPLLNSAFPEPSGPPLISIGIVAYSPDDLTNTMVIATNRPWASLVYFGTQNQWISENKKWVFGLNSLVGMLGVDIAETAQAGIHVITDSDDPQGWHHQISDGGELTAMIAANVDLCLLQVPGRRGPWDPKVPRSYDRVQLWAGGGASGGYRTAANVHAGVAAGVITRPFFAHGAGGISPAQLGASPAGTRGRAVYDAENWLKNLGRWCWRIVPEEAYGYGSATGTAMLYDVSLEGQFRNSDLEFGESVETWRDAYAYGGALTWGNLTVGYQRKAESRELDFESGYHYYGLLYLQMKLRY